MVQPRLHNRIESTAFQLLNHLPLEALTIPLYYPYTHTITPDNSAVKSDNLYQDVTVEVVMRSAYVRKRIALHADSEALTLRNNPVTSLIKFERRVLIEMICLEALRQSATQIAVRHGGY
jgi:hypothetical protein